MGMELPWWLSSKESAWDAKDTGDAGQWVRKTPWRRAWQPTLVFLPGKSHGQRSLTGYSPWSHKELDTTEVTENACKVGMKSGDGESQE